jgi:hypothetical protein
MRTEDVHGPHRNVTGTHPSEPAHLQSSKRVDSAKSVDCRQYRECRVKKVLVQRVQTVSSLRRGGLLLMIKYTVQHNNGATM